ncbi:hypothetical protein Daus18300_002450 [Diaporthe australafricana]|uniref:Uncharacterized protein n=1 Tax=Diaporthe australafricana TaxID=127596 RepID=A0ABR3XNA3_9PEZI
MDTHHEEKTQDPSAAPSADADEEVTTTTLSEAPEAPAAPSPNEGKTTTAEDAPPASGPPDGPPEQDDPNVLLREIIECHHKGCDKCHASMDSKDVLTPDVTNRHEKVVQIALRMICAFHEEVPMITSVDLSSRSENDISCLMVEVSTSEWPEGW